jgi:hypothetical protein
VKIPLVVSWCVGETSGSVGEIFWTKLFRLLSRSIRRTKHKLITKLITQIDGKS